METEQEKDFINFLQALEACRERDVWQFVEASGAKSRNCLFTANLIFGEFHQRMTIKYFLSSRFSMEISTFLESYLKCLNAVRVLNLSDDVQIVICFPNENQKMIQLIPVHLRGVSIVSPLWALSSIICKALQPVVRKIEKDHLQHFIFF